MKKLALLAMVATLMLAFTTRAVMAQEKAKAEKAKGVSTVTVLLENERVRVSDNRLKPGDKNEMKERPDRVFYFIKGGEFKRHYPDGKTENVKRKDGEVAFTKKNTAALENVGKTEAHWIGIQLK